MIVAELLSVGLGGRQRGLCASRDHVALVLCNRSEDMKRKLRCHRIVAAYEVDLAVHQRRDLWLRLMLLGLHDFALLA
jgi:hypothetical protein